MTRARKCSILGCPHIPAGFLSTVNFQVDKFQKTGLKTLSHVGNLLFNTRPVFGAEFTKRRLLSELESSELVFLSTLSSNQSDSMLVCAESHETPSSFEAIGGYHTHCLLDSVDLEFVDTHACALLVLDCYSSVNHKPRVDLAKKMLSRGCKSVLLVLSPLTDSLMLQFYSIFFAALKSTNNSSRLPIAMAFTRAIRQLASLNQTNSSSLDESLLMSSFCLLSADSRLELSLDELEKSMCQYEVDRTFEKLKKHENIEFLNPKSSVSIVSPDFKSYLERTLIQLQILVKFLLNQSITETITTESSVVFRDTVLYLNELIAKSIAYMAFTKARPERCQPLVLNNPIALNLLKLLGFGLHRESVYVVRDRRDHYVLFFPDQRYMDLALRSSHVLASVIDLCFSQTSNAGHITIERVRAVVASLEALMPVSKPLLNSLLDIVSLARFSPEIVLSLTDETIRHALLTSGSSRRRFDHFYLINRDIFAWNLDSLFVDPKIVESTAKLDSKSIRHSQKSNPALTFLISIGFEVIGSWLHFSHTPFNTFLLDLSLKLLSSFHPERDMTLYKEMNLNVLGQRSAATSGGYGGAAKSAESNSGGLLTAKINKPEVANSSASEENVFDVMAAEPWCTLVEDRSFMNDKIDFVEKYKQMSARLSKQRREAMRHHVNYVMRQSVVNAKEPADDDDQKSDETTEEESHHQMKVIKLRKPKRVKYKPGGSPSKTRVIVNEKYKISYEEISQVRAYSHFVSRKNVDKINEENRERAQKLLLPLIKKL